MLHYKYILVSYQVKAHNQALCIRHEKGEIKNWLSEIIIINEEEIKMIMVAIIKREERGKRMDFLCKISNKLSSHREIVETTDARTISHDLLFT